MMKKELAKFLTLVISTVSLCVPVYANESKGTVLNEIIIEVPNSKLDLEKSNIYPKAND